MTVPPSPCLALVGCGRWGANLARNFAQLGALAAICDHDKDLAANAARRHGVPVRLFTDVLADPNITAVAIATPAATHALLAREAILAGKHVFVEKPLALNVEEARALVDLAKAHSRILMVGHLLQYHPAFSAIRDLVRDGHLGRIRYVSSSRLNLGQVRTEENSLWSFAPHDISMILALINDLPESITALGHCYLHKSITDVTTTHLQFPAGQAAHIHVSWLHPVKEQRLVVVGDKAMAVFDDGREWDSKVQIFAHEISWHDGRPHAEKVAPVNIPVTRAEPLELECRHLLECLAGSHPPLTDGEEGLRVLRVLDGAQRSLESGTSVQMIAPRPTTGAVIHPTAAIDAPSVIGDGTRIWHFTHVLKNSRIGRDCNIGQNVVIGPDVTIGDRCKIQNNVSVYPGVTLEDGVFCGPSMVFTNVINPRAEIERKHEYRPTLVKRGATIGANATLVCGHTIGRYALIGAGAVVTRDVPDFGLAVGNPARVIGWVCTCGTRLADGDWTATACPACAKSYHRDGDTVTEITS